MFWFSYLLVVHVLSGDAALLAGEGRRRSDAERAPVDVAVRGRARVLVRVPLERWEIG